MNARDIAECMSLARQTVMSDADRSPMFRRDRMVVVAVRDGTLDLSSGSSGIKSTVNGVPMTTACSGVKVGDVVIVDTYDRVPIAIGVLQR